MSILIFPAALVGVTVLQVTWGESFRILGIGPDLFLLLLFFLSLPAEPETAIAMGFLLGIYQDTFSGSPLGLRAFSFSLVGFLLAKLAKELYLSKLMTQALLLFLAVCASGLATLLNLYFFRLSRPFLETLLGLILPEAIYTTLAGLLVMVILSTPPLRKVHHES